MKYSIQNRGNVFHLVDTEHNDKYRQGGVTKCTRYIVIGLGDRIYEKEPNLPLCKQCQSVLSKRIYRGSLNKTLHIRISHNTP